MRVAMYYNNRDVRIEEAPRPKIGPDEILVKIHASGVCGSDVMEWYRLAKAPLVLGHEIAGEIAEVGANVGEWNVGDRVFVTHHVPCNMCRYCLDDHHACCDLLSSTTFDPGGFAEFVRVPAINVRNGTYALPDSMTYEEGSFIEPLACVYRAQHNAGWKPGRRVLVIGSGIAGIMHIHLARMTGASRIIAADINPRRLESARDAGADETLLACDDLTERIEDLNEGRRAELVIVCAGAVPALNQAFRSVDRGGTILFFAPSDPGAQVDMPFNDLWRQEVTITSSYAGAPRDIRAAIEIIASGRMDVTSMITHRLPLEKTGEAFAMVADPAGDSLKVVIEPQK